MISYVGVALVAMDGIGSREDAQRLVRRMTLCAMGMVISGIVQFFGHDLNWLLQIPGLQLNSEAEVGSRSIFNRPYGTTLHPIEFGVVSAALIPLAYWIARSDGRRRGYVVMAMLGFAAMTSLSRSAVLAAAVAGLVVFIGVSWKRRLAILTTSIVFVAVAGMLVDGLVGTLKNLFTTANDDTSVQARVSRTPRVLQLISEHPFIGRGFGTYNIDDYLLLDNQIQNVAIEMGLIGVAVLAVFIGFVIVMALTTRVGDEVSRLGGTALIATISGLIISSYTFDAFFYRILMGVLYLSIGLVGATYRLTSSERSGHDEILIPRQRLTAARRELNPSEA
jgi:O-antigen ligase